MQLYLVQHGASKTEAEDPQRPLSDKGRRTVEQMADYLGSLVSREIKHNRRKIRKRKRVRNGPYEATVAEHKAYVRRKYAKFQGKKIEEDKRLRRSHCESLLSSWVLSGVNQ